jgi:Asp-tRNA(Asn)/Glu-tRNA(Gln) amidotransferase A subunit family amidase
MPGPDPTKLSALDLRDRIARGEMRAAEVAAAHLKAIEAREPEVQAFAFLDPKHVMAQAEMADRFRAAGRPLGALHGVPVAIKDVIDTRDMPTENGTVLDAGRRPAGDAMVVQRLREAGAIILGKTVTAELASYTPGKTRNPHDPRRTPGGSSSGSAAAVAAFMAPLALGTQTNGSVIRPASFCGVVGYKPSRGLVSRSGVLVQSPTLDTVGVFARSVEDAALVADVLAGHDPRDRQTVLSAPPDLLRLAMSPPPVRPLLAFVKSPVWEQAEEDVKAGFAELVEALGGGVEEIELPAPFDRGHGLHGILMIADVARNYARYAETGREQLSAKMAGLIDEGSRLLAVDYCRALDMIEVMNAGLDKLFEHFDALITPAAPGEAPLGLEATGNPAFATLWTYCGVPAVTLPLLVGSNDLPIGVQLVGRRMYDGRLLRTARWLSESLQAAGRDASVVTGAVA